MKYDNWETDFRENYDEWDVYDPPQNLWERIDQSLETPHPIQKNNGSERWLYPLMACAVAIAFLFGIIGGNHHSKIIRTPEILPQQVALNGHDDAVEKQLLSQINHLTTLYQELQEELPQSENPDRVLEAMKENLTMQQMVLSQLQLIVKRIKTIQHESPTRL